MSLQKYDNAHIGEITCHRRDRPDGELFLMAMLGGWNLIGELEKLEKRLPYQVHLAFYWLHMAMEIDRF